MKTCKYCGSEIEMGQEYCSSCGAKQEETTDAVENYKKKPQKAKKIIVATLLVIIFAGAAIGGLALLNQYKNETFIFADTEGNYTEITRGEIQDDLDKAKAHAEKAEYLKAIELLRTIPNTYTQYEDVKKQLDIVLEAYCQDMVTQAEALLKAEKYNEAITLLAEAEKNAGESPVLSQKKEEILGAYKAEAIARVQELSKEEKYTEALALLGTAQDIFGAEDTEIATQMADVNAKKVLAALPEYEASGDLGGAIQFIDKELPGTNNNADVIERRNSLQAQYREQVVSKAAETYAAEGYTAAISVVNEAIAVLPGDETILEQLAMYKSYAPTYLSTLTPYTEKYIYIGLDGGKDNYENAYIGDRCFSANNYYYDGELKYNIASKYTTLSGILFVPYFSRNNDTEEATIEVYGDDVLLYEVTNISNTSKPQNFSVDISNVEFLTIRFIDAYASGGSLLTIGEAAVSNAPLV